MNTTIILQFNFAQAAWLILFIHQMISLKGIHELPSVGSIDEKGCKKSRACKPKLLLLEKFKCGGVIFEQVLSFPVFLKIFLRLISLSFQCPSTLDQSINQFTNL
ncbi:hypothetical protein [Marinifilum sp. D714]|uniref:hypothetical protein n=1 Tax=Marinifilum sp. D714 TaxID=2937523 RepID=UPI0027C8BA5A|nr:hypothetical protein [Marinifilum sp. D714]MDQ2178086.1 hypothetical protein [Marinifilum sp. D714]